MREKSKCDVFYEKFFTLVYSTALHFCQKNVDDVVQDFIEKKILKGDFLDRLSTVENQEGFIFTSVGNFCKTQIRLEKKKESFSLDEISSLNSTGENKVNEIEFSDEFDHILSTLPSGQRIVIKKTIEGYNDSEIADLLNITVNSVRQKKNRARTKIKKALDP